MKFNLLFILMLAVCSKGPGQTKISSTDSSNILLIMQKLMDAVATGDTLVWNKYLNKDYIMQAEDGVLKTKKECMIDLKPLPKGYQGSIKVTKPTIRKHKNIYILNSVMDEYLALYGQTIHTYYAQTDVLLKKRNRWEILATEVFELHSDPPIYPLDPGKLKRYVGTYQLDSTVLTTVFIEDDQLYSQRNNRVRMPLFPEAEGVFFTPGQRVRKIFLPDHENNFDKMIERRSGVDLVWKKAK